LRGNKNVHTNFDVAIESDNEIIVPRAVDYELERGFAVTPAPKKQAMYNVLTDKNGNCNIADMDENFWDEAKQIYADLRHKSYTIGEMDILIAAFCLCNGYTLVTNNTKDFKKINGLTITDWTEER